MNELVKAAIDTASSSMEKAIGHLESGLAKIRAGKASTQMLDGLFIDYYGSSTPVSQVANINTPDARTITIQPWEKNLIGAIEKAIFAANLGFTPQNDGLLIRINIPPLTEDRRKELVKQSKAEGEHAKVSIRNARRDGNEFIKKLIKDGLAEDLGKDAEANIQTLTDSFIARADKLLEQKEKEIMTV
jgi:ribosome recycling factor